MARLALPQMKEDERTHVTRCRARAMPLVRFSGKKCCVQAIRGSLGSPPARRGPVSRSHAEPPSTAVPRTLTARVHPSRSGSSSESLRSHSPAGCRNESTPSQPARVLRPSARQHRSASTCRGGSQLPATFRPQAFSASRRFTPRSSFAGLFHPAAVSRALSRSGASLSAQPGRLIGESSAPLSFGSPPLR